MGIEVHEECENFVRTAKELWVLMKRFCGKYRELLFASVSYCII